MIRSLNVFARGAFVGDIFMLHEEEYGVKPEVVVSAPGSVNLLGEHTDYNEGWILQAAIDKTAKVAISKRTDNSLRFFAADFGERKRTTIANLKYKREDRWANFSKGVISEINHLGFNFKGMDITISSDIPFGIGLASSAAISIATAVAISNVYDLDLSDMQIIKCAQLSEKVFIQKEISLADQFVACLAKPGTALYLDLRTLEYEYIPIEFGEDYFLITNSNVPKVSAETYLMERIEACRACVKHLNAKKEGNALRDYNVEDLKTGIGLVPEHIRRLCMHVVEENQRVLEAKNFLKSKDLLSFGKLMNRSHESLRDSFEVSCPEIDWLVKRAWEIEGIYGSRLTGSGFGGCTISLVKENALPLYKERLDEYEHIFGFDAELIKCVPSGGVKVTFNK